MTRRMVAGQKLMMRVYQLESVRTSMRNAQKVQESVKPTEMEGAKASMEWMGWLVAVLGGFTVQS